MGEVIDLEDRKTRDLPHYVGLILCITCNNKWTGTFPQNSPITMFQCPRCGDCNSFTSFIPPGYVKEERKST